MNLPWYPTVFETSSEPASISTCSHEAMLTDQYPSILQNDVYVPYATWLVENDEFDQAQEGEH